VSGREGRARGARAAALAVLALLVSSCGGGGDGFVSTPPPTLILGITPQSATVNPGASATFTVTISGGSPTPTLASCASSSAAIATVTRNGSTCVATGVSAGSANITGTLSGGQTVTASLTVQALPAAITTFQLAPATATVPTGQTVTLTPTITSPAGATVSVSYTSSNPAIATVSQVGVVTGVTVGSAVITATAQGSGTGFTPATIVRTANITVTVDPCTPTLVTLPFSGTGSVTSTSCLISSTVQRRGNVARVNLTAPAALEVRMTPNGFAPYIAALPAGEADFIFSSRQTFEEVRRVWHLGAGPIDVRVGALNTGQTGSYQLQLSTVSASIENCTAVIIAGSLTSQQTLSATDCVFAGRLADEFLVYSTRPCTITMTSGAGAAGVLDPFLEAYAGTTLVSSDDDGAGELNARLQLPTCRSASDDILTVRATTFDPNDTGTYALTVVFGSAAVADAAQGAEVRAPLKRVPAPTTTQSTPRTGGTWLEYIGIERTGARGY